MTQIGVESENGWRPAKVGPDQLNWITVPGTHVTLQIQKGQPTAILGAFAADFNAYVEPLRDNDSACWTPTNSVATSNHLNGTACDLNWNSHPFHVPNTFNPAQRATLEELLTWYEGTVFWGGKWKSPIDEMHVQMGYDTWNNPHTQDFINRKIRPDGYSTFRRGTAPAAPQGLTVDTLADAMGNRAGVDYPTMYPYYRSACDLIGGAGHLNRLAMFAAQVGHESGGLQYMEEIASGAAYEGRTDLGNTQPGDGVKYKGRGPIQITGRTNYSKLSAWAFSEHLVPTATFFVDQPDQLAIPRYGFLGACWYWIQARPAITQMCDDGNIVGVTKAINGGLNGLEDRTNRWNHALAMGLPKLDVAGGHTTTTEGEDMAQVPQEQWDRVYRELTQKLTSRSPLRHLGEGPLDTVAGFVLNCDGSEHVEITKLLASLGHPPSLAILHEVASADPARYPDRQADALMAQAILADLKTSPTAVVATQVPTVAPTVYTAPAPGPLTEPTPEPVPVEPPAPPPKPDEEGDTVTPQQLYELLLRELSASGSTKIVTPDGENITLRQAIEEIHYKERGLHGLEGGRPRHPNEKDDQLGQVLSARAEGLFTQALVVALAEQSGIDAQALYNTVKRSLGE